MEGYREMKTRLGRKCAVREIPLDQASGRRWHIRVKGRKGGPETFYLFAERDLPADPNRIMSGVLSAVDRELGSDRSDLAKWPPDYEQSITPSDFDD